MLAAMNKFFTENGWEMKESENPKRYQEIWPVIGAEG